MRFGTLGKHKPMKNESGKAAYWISNGCWIYLL